MCERACVCTCVCACVRVYGRACVCLCARACVKARATRRISLPESRARHLVRLDGDIATVKAARAPGVVAQRRRARHLRALAAAAATRRERRAKISTTQYRPGVGAPGTRARDGEGSNTSSAPCEISNVARIPIFCATDPGSPPLSPFAAIARGTQPPAPQPTGLCNFRLKTAKIVHENCGK